MYDTIFFSGSDRSSSATTAVISGTLGAGDKKFLKMEEGDDRLPNLDDFDKEIEVFQVSFLINI